MSAGRRAERGAGARSLLLTLAVLALLAVVAFLLSERNARQYTLVLEDGVLSVKKGILAPMGYKAFKPDDPVLAAAYAPLKPPPGFSWKEEQVFEDRAALDQALFDLLAKWARDDIASEKPELVERAMGWLGRADKLAGISGAQREDLRALRAESGYFEARQLLDKTAESLRQVRERLRLTAGSSSRHAGDAGEALRRVEPMIDELYQAGRALGGSSMPIPSPTSTSNPTSTSTSTANPTAATPDGGVKR
ncbi:MAG TPA: hypothetical protein VEM76_21230 [Anaeromyxobacteraceae bacterium]|nr:hypothetical protein [Anaeromyxobacteraceae bacterium]